MKKKSKNSLCEKVYVFSAIFFLVDQVLKLLIIENLHLGEKLTVIPHFFYLYYLKNTGAAFSILEGKSYFLILVAVISIFMIDYYIRKEMQEEKLEIISIGMLLGGILGNLVDRLLYKTVIDYLSFEIFNYHAPVFNFADICITIGIVLFFINMLKGEILKWKSKKKS